MWFLLFLLFCPYLSYADNCTTPFGKQSNCIPIRDCPSLLSVVQKAVDPQVGDFIRQSKCSCNTEKPRVCCGPLPKSYEEESLVKNIDLDDLDDSYLAPDNQCGENLEVDRIYGGRSAMVGEFPWLAQLWYRKHQDTKLNYQCGGMLINRRFVLTAGHCIYGVYLDQHGKLVSVRLGEHDVRSEIDCDDVCGEPPQNIQVLHTYPHPEYAYNSFDKHNDIGLVKLATRAKYSNFVAPICLDRSAQWNTGDEVIVAGWGKTLKGTSSPKKLKVSLSVADQNSCKQQFLTYHKVDIVSTQLCVGGEFSKDACSGDSGGPATRQRQDGQWEAIGLVSFGYDCGRENWPAVYTVISSYYDWIVNTVKNNNMCPGE